MKMAAGRRRLSNQDKNEECMHMLLDALTIAALSPRQATSFVMMKVNIIRH